MAILWRRFKLRLRCLWAALRGEQVELYWSLIQHQPVGYRLTIHGTLAAEDHAAIMGCRVRPSAPCAAGIQVGQRSIVIGCMIFGFATDLAMDPKGRSVLDGKINWN